MANPNRYLRLVLASVEEPGSGIRRYVLQDRDGWPLPPFQPGAHVDIHLPGLVRTYSLCNAPHDNHRYVIAVKREENGRGGSVRIHEELKQGMEVGVSLPRAGLPIVADTMNVFIAGGIGVTPFLSAISELEQKGQTNYVLHWASRGPHPLDDMLAKLTGSTQARIVRHDTLAGPIPDLNKIVHAYGPEARACCCGPTSMLDAFEAAVADWPENRKHVERFTPPRSALAQHTSHAYLLELSKSHKSVRVEPGTSLLAALEALDADVPVSCGGGICGACRTRWIEGPPQHHDRVLSPQERTQEVIVCVAGCAGDKLVLDL